MRAVAAEGRGAVPPPVARSEKVMDQRWLKAFYGPSVGQQLAADLEAARDEEDAALARGRAIGKDKRIDHITNGVICTPPYSPSDSEKVPDQ